MSRRIHKMFSFSAIRSSADRPTSPVQVREEFANRLTATVSALSTIPFRLRTPRLVTRPNSVGRKNDLGGEVQGSA